MKMGGHEQACCAQDPTPRVNRLAAVLLPGLGVAVFAVTLFQVLFLSQGTHSLFRDSDAGWHIRNGEAILGALSVPRADPFSFTKEGREWFAWEWLSDALLGGAHRMAGLPGVALIVALVIALTVWGFLRLSLSLGGDFLLTAGSTVLVLGVTSIHWLARPHVFSWLLALLFLAVAESERRRPGRLPRWLPLLACLWANMHGSFLLGPGILFCYALGEGMAGRERRRSGLRFVLAGLASLAATLVNPYGWRLHAHVVSYLRDDYLMDHISEFRSFSFHSPGAVYVELFLLAAVLGGLAMLRQRSFGPVLLTLGLLHLSLFAARHLPIGAVLLLPLSTAALTREAEGIPRLRRMLEYSRRLHAIDRRVWGLLPVVLVLAGAIAGLTFLTRAGHVGFNASRFPVRAADFLDRQDPAGRVFTKDQWGGYLIYRFAGGRKVFLDGRSDFYGREMLETYAQVVEVRPGWETVLDRYDVRFVLAAPDQALASALRLNPRWRPVHEDPVAAVFERAG